MRQVIVTVMQAGAQFPNEATLNLLCIKKGPVAPQGKSSGTATGSLHVLSTLHVKYRSAQMPLLAAKRSKKKKKLTKKKNKGYLAS